MPKSSNGSRGRSGTSNCDPEPGSPSKGSLNTLSNSTIAPNAELSISTVQDDLDRTAERFLRIQNPMLSLLRQNLGKTESSASGTQSMTKSADENEYYTLMREYKTLSSLKFQDFITLTDDDFKDWMSEEPNVSFGHKRAIRRLWNNYKT